MINRIVIGIIIIMVVIIISSSNIIIIIVNIYLMHLLLGVLFEDLVVGLQGVVLRLKSMLGRVVVATHQVELSLRLAKSLITVLLLLLLLLSLLLLLCIIITLIITKDLSICSLFIEEAVDCGLSHCRGRDVGSGSRGGGSGQIDYSINILFLNHPDNTIICSNSSS